uniref:Uncharacterized protein n=1 Tax=viral metagenome TaxID=1070528 RepID=A0A6C0BV83_9ZZZZ
MTFMETHFLYLPVELKIRIMKCIPGWNSPYIKKQYIYVALGGKGSEYTIAQVTGFVYDNNQYDYELRIMPRITKDILNPLPRDNHLDTLHYLTIKRFHWRRVEAIKCCSDEDFVSDLKKSYNILIELQEIESNKADTDPRPLFYITNILRDFRRKLICLDKLI